MIDYSKLSDTELESIIKAGPVLNGTPEQQQTWARAYREREIRKKVQKRVEADQRREARERYNKDFNNEVEGRLSLMGH